MEEQFGDLSCLTSITPEDGSTTACCHFEPINLAHQGPSADRAVVKGDTALTVGTQIWVREVVDWSFWPVLSLPHHDFNCRELTGATRAGETGLQRLQERPSLADRETGMGHTLACVCQARFWL
eukprot:2699083-Rhodomonas_salina.1